MIVVSKERDDEYKNAINYPQTKGDMMVDDERK